MLYRRVSVVLRGKCYFSRFNMMFGPVQVGTNLFLFVPQFAMAFVYSYNLVEHMALRSRARRDRHVHLRQLGASLQLRQIIFCLRSFSTNHSDLTMGGVCKLQREQYS